jgi:hypothetical protein
MGNYAARRNKLLVGWEIDAALMVFRGKSNRDIAIEALSANPDDPKDLKNKIQRVTKLIRSDKFEEYYKTMIKEWSIRNVGRALNKLTEQVDMDDQPWLANKAANDILQRAPKSYFQSEDEATFKIVVEGAPTLGIPTDEGCEG